MLNLMPKMPQKRYLHEGETTKQQSNNQNLKSKISETLKIDYLMQKCYLSTPLQKNKNRFQSQFAKKKGDADEICLKQKQTYSKSQIILPLSDKYKKCPQTHQFSFQISTQKNNFNFGEFQYQNKQKYKLPLKISYYKFKNLYIRKKIKQQKIQNESLQITTSSHQKFEQLYQRITNANLTNFSYTSILQNQRDIKKQQKVQNDQQNDKHLYNNKGLITSKIQKCIKYKTDVNRKSHRRILKKNEALRHFRQNTDKSQGVREQQIEND